MDIFVVISWENDFKWEQIKLCYLCLWTHSCFSARWDSLTLMPFALKHQDSFTSMNNFTLQHNLSFHKHWYSLLQAWGGDGRQPLTHHTTWEWTSRETIGCLQRRSSLSASASCSYRDINLILRSWNNTDSCWVRTQHNDCMSNESLLLSGECSVLTFRQLVWTAADSGSVQRVCESPVFVSRKGLKEQVCSDEFMELVSSHWHLLSWS